MLRQARSDDFERLSKSLDILGVKKEDILSVDVLYIDYGCLYTVIYWKE